MESPSLSDFKYRLDIHLTGMRHVMLISNGRTDEKTFYLAPCSLLIQQLLTCRCLFSYFTAIHRPKGICHFTTEATQKSGHKKRTPVATQIYKKPVLLSAATGNHILGAELRKGPRRDERSRKHDI